MFRPSIAVVTAVLLTFIASAFATQDEPKEPKEPELPPAIEAILSKAEGEIDKEKQRFYTAAKKVCSKLTGDLEKEVERATKAGDLKLALALQKKIDMVSQGDFLQGLLNGQSDLRSPPVLNGAGLVGRWSFWAGEVIINPNGYCEHSDGHGAKIEISPKEKRAVMRWKNGASDWIELVPNDVDTAKGGNMDGAKWEWKRVK